MEKSLGLTIVRPEVVGGPLSSCCYTRGGSSVVIPAVCGGDPSEKKKTWIPASAGMTEEKWE
ncbi:MAG: hypothetical protein QNL45_05120 [Nitrospirota bacterium]|nr:hypothetical protein [Nitrospirota bacterium]